MKKRALGRRLVVRRETVREIAAEHLKFAAAAASSGTDVSNNCCSPTCETITCQPPKPKP